MTTVPDQIPDWAAEPSNLPGHARVRARIAGLHCSLYTGTIEKALGRRPGVVKVSVSLTHEQALVDYDPGRISGGEILTTLRDIGYDLYDPRKLRPFEEEEAVLVREGVRLLAAAAAALTAIAPAAAAILRPAGRLRAAAGTLGIVAPGTAALALRATGALSEAAAGWVTGALAVVMMGVVTPHFARMAYQSLRRAILNQHVLLEVGALAGIAGGVIGLSGLLPRCPTAAFFAVTVLITTYHTFSEWLSLLVKTRSSQAVKKLLDLRPDTALVVRDGVETEVDLDQVAVGDLVRIRPGERVPVDGMVSSGYSAQAADEGIVMRTGEAFQTLRQVRTMVLDKTGTLTLGKPAVRGIHAHGLDEAELLSLAAAAEHSSEHPLARAVVAAATARGLAWPEAGEFTSLTGLGVAARVAGRRVLVGRPSLLADRGIGTTPLDTSIDSWTGSGHTVIVVTVDDILAGVIALGDTLRPEAADTVAALRQAGITPLLVTGDNARAAAHIADQVGISEVPADIHPDQKAQIIRGLQTGGRRVAMVGDGINDAPALMQADVGIAIGTGTDIAMESADIILVRDHLHLILAAHRISRTSYRKVKQNVALAFTFNGIGIPAAATGLVYPVWAMIAMAASVTAIFANSIGTRPTLLFQAISSVGRTPHSPKAPPRTRMNASA